MSGSTHRGDSPRHANREMLPPAFFKDKDARDFRFHIMEDIVQAESGALSVSVGERVEDISPLYEDVERVALYVHSPWCVERCSYCYYWGQAENQIRMRELVAAEQAHSRILDKRIGLDHKTVPSIYFGGGTPTILPIDILEQSMSFWVGRYGKGDCEVCCEGSVASLRPEKLKALEPWVTRLSIGVQSFDDGLLRAVGRIFTGEQAEVLLRDVIPRFHSVNIDLIYGLCGQSQETWIDTVDTAIALGVPSVTLYRLEVRSDQPLIATFEANPESYPGEEQCIEFREMAAERLCEAGYRENLLGWFLLPSVEDTVVYRERWEHQTPCIAFGPGVQNYGSDYYYETLANHDLYISEVNAGRLPNIQLRRLGNRGRLLWYLLALWKSGAALPTHNANERYGRTAVAWLLGELQPAEADGLVECSAGFIGLTGSGRAVIEWIMRDLIGALSKVGAAPSTSEFLPG